MWNPHFYYIEKLCQDSGPRTCIVAIQYVPPFPSTRPPLHLSFGSLNVDKGTGLQHFAIVSLTADYSRNKLLKVR